MDIFDIFWRYRMEGKIDQLSQQRDDADGRLDSLHQQLAKAKTQLTHANLVIGALWELQEEKLGLTLEQVHDKMTAIQSRSPSPDAAGPCFGCGRPIPPQREKCMYCGGKRAAAGPVDALKEL